MRMASLQSNAATQMSALIQNDSCNVSFPTRQMGLIDFSKARLQARSFRNDADDRCQRQSDTDAQMASQSQSIQMTDLWCILPRDVRTESRFANYRVFPY